MTAPRAAQPTLRRNLSLIDLVVYGMLFIGITAPMGTFGVLDARSGGITPVVFLLAAAAMGATAYSYARMSHAVPRAGSVYAYAEAALGQRPAFLAGWMLSLDYIFIPAMAVLFMGIAAHALAPAIPVWVFTLVGVGLITILNLAGVKLAARVGMVMLGIGVLELVGFAAGAIGVLASDGPSRDWLSPLTGVAGFDVSALLGAGTVAALAFLGFDAIASFAEETTGSTRQTGRALRVCLIVAAALFVAQTYLASLIMPLTPAELAADPAAQGTAFYDMLRTEIGGWLSYPITFMRAIGPVFSALVAQAAAARLLFAMGRDGDAPAALGRIDGHDGVPRNATLATAGVTLVVSTLAALRADGLEILSSMVTVGALTAFLFLHVAAIRYYAFQRGEGVKAAIVPVLGIVIVLALLVDASSLALAIAGAWALIGIVIVLTRWLRRA
ncbi:APC family permease [Nanchangia anserum]|uniref:APC family permease n=1 Tax=Nanchangia anserum TaxID=2692125 RepID=A0A8I0GCI3_9ACTO|nr:APC family permease [Nanchangia anserum]MBD3689043.1 APC family permease [Nanchangia anserum]QOX81287.1 APC family permease [Nanchangia anserum]